MLVKIGVVFGFGFKSHSNMIAKRELKLEPRRRGEGLVTTAAKQRSA